MGEIDICDIAIELDNRDEIFQLPRGLQYIYGTESLCKPIFNLL
jgi:hypothetical protein